jgi:hypothetical protein
MAFSRHCIQGVTMEMLNFNRVILFRSTQEKNLLIVLYTVQKPFCVVR